MSLDSITPMTSEDAPALAKVPDDGNEFLHTASVLEHPDCTGSFSFLAAVQSRLSTGQTQIITTTLTDPDVEAA